MPRKQKRGKRSTKRRKTHRTKRRKTHRTRRQKMRPSDKRMMFAIRKLKRVRPQHQREAMKLSNASFIRSLSTQVNKLRGKTLPAGLHKHVQKQRKQLQKFVRKNTSLTMKRKMLSQRGGLLPLLLAALPAVTGLMANVVSAATS